MGWLVAATLILALLVLMATALPIPQVQAPPPTMLTEPLPGVVVHSAAPAVPGGVVMGLPSAGVPGSGAAATPVGGAAAPSLPVGVGVGGVRRGRGWREWRRGDPTLINSLWKSKQPLGIRNQLGNAEVYIVLALLIGVVTVVIGCWLSDNCWSPEPEHVVTLA